MRGDVALFCRKDVVERLVFLVKKYHAVLVVDVVLVLLDDSLLHGCALRVQSQFHELVFQHHFLCFSIQRLVKESRSVSSCLLQLVLLCLGLRVFGFLLLSLLCCLFLYLLLLCPYFFFRRLVPPTEPYQHKSYQYKSYDGILVHFVISCSL